MSGHVCFIEELHVQSQTVSKPAETRINMSVTKARILHSGYRDWASKLLSGEVSVVAWSCFADRSTTLQVHPIGKKM